MFGLVPPDGGMGVGVDVSSELDMSAQGMVLGMSMRGSMGRTDSGISSQDQDGSGNYQKRPAQGNQHQRPRGF